jgi:hypothetical protein
MPSITVPRDFFLSERNSAYADWPGAFWRELLSNAVDAGASRLHVRTRFAADGGFLIDIADNGGGMSRETIETVYMRLGASTKRDDSGIGGFGRARILTCFSQRAYRIRTSNLVVTGEGGDYEIRETDTSVKGCAISVTADPEEARRLTRALTRVLRQSGLSVSITADLVREGQDGQTLLREDDAAFWGEGGANKGDVARFRGWTRRGTHIRTLTDEAGPWGEVYVSHGEKGLRETSIVRVNGMAMHDDHLSARAQIIIELTPERAREILTSARDSIRAPWRHELQKLYAEVASESTSALRSRTQEKRTILIPTRGGGSGLAPPAPKGVLPEPTYVPYSEFGRRNEDRAREAVRAMTVTLDEPDPVYLDDPVLAELLRIKEAIPGARTDVGVHIDSPNPAQRAAIRRFLPETWAAPGGDGRNAELLHAAWTGACRHALEGLVRAQPYAFERGDRWVTGFVFDERIRACHARVGEVPHGLLLNPVDGAGRTAFKLKSRDDLRQIGALACHEVAHCVHSWHDESFANLLTQLQYETSERGFEKAIREEMDLARDWMGRREAAWAEADRRMVDLGLAAQGAMGDIQARIDAIRGDRTIRDDPSP